MTPSWQPDQNVRLAPLTTWKIGGPADWFATPETENELGHALDWAAARELPVHFIGRGSNLLVSDDGVRGLVICLRKYDKDRHQLLNGHEPAQLEVSAGMSLPRLAKVAARYGFTGYEFYIGIPGTVGGAVVMNAGFGPGDERQTANRCLEVLSRTPAGEATWQPYSDFKPGYRSTGLQKSGRIVIAARFGLIEKSTPEAIRTATAGHLTMRRLKQPLTRPTAGSVFKATADGTPAAVYIDRCGLKGNVVGGAMVSPKHANWIENMGEARAADVLTLIDQVRDTVKRKEGVSLEPELCFLH